MTEKMTHKEMFAYIAEKMADDKMVVDFCEERIAQLSKSRKPRKTDEEVVAFRAAVATALAEQDGPMTAKALAEILGEERSNRTAAALRALANDGIVESFAGEKARDPKTYAMVTKEAAEVEF